MDTVIFVAKALACATLLLLSGIGALFVLQVVKKARALRDPAEFDRIVGELGLGERNRVR